MELYLHSPIRFYYVVLIKHRVKFNYWLYERYVYMYVCMYVCIYVRMHSGNSIHIHISSLCRPITFPHILSPSTTYILCNMVYTSTSHLQWLSPL